MVALRNDMAASRGEEEREVEDRVFCGTAFYSCVVSKSRKVKTTPLLNIKFSKMV